MKSVQIYANPQGKTVTISDVNLHSHCAALKFVWLSMNNFIKKRVHVDKLKSTPHVLQSKVGNLLQDIHVHPTSAEKSVTRKVTSALLLNNPHMSSHFNASPVITLSVTSKMCTIFAPPIPINTSKLIIFAYFPHCWHLGRFFFRAHYYRNLSDEKADETL